ncbi:MAG: hypothetical protein FJY07_12605 [Bacteroidetes bacterium]|nr:hypothetical protein [Bacteroidota bacterium]
MPALTNEFIEGVRSIPHSGLQKLVLKLAKGNQEIIDIVNIEYLQKKEAINDLYETTLAKVEDHIALLSFRGPVQKSIASAMSKAIKDINYFAKLTSDHYKEAFLLDTLLSLVFNDFSKELGTCWTVMDSKLGITTQRLLNIVTKKLHEDLVLDFKDHLNRYLEILHRNSNHINVVYSLPQKI